MAQATKRSRSLVRAKRLECGESLCTLPEPFLIASQAQSRCRVPVLELPSPSPLPSPLGRGNSSRHADQIQRRVLLSPLSDHLQNSTEDNSGAFARHTTGEGSSLSPRERAGVRGNRACEGHEGYGRVKCPRSVWLLFFCGFLSSRPLQAAEETPKLRPPRGELLPSFWEQHGWLIVAGAVVLLGLAALVVWRSRRAKPVVTVPPDVIACRALEALGQRTEDVGLVVEVSRIVRRYALTVFVLQNDELTTEELLKEVRACFPTHPELLAALGNLLRECDTRKFAPVSQPAASPIVPRALELIAKLESHRHPPPSVPTAQPGPTAATASPAA